MADDQQSASAPQSGLSPEQLEGSEHLEKRSVGGEARYYVKDLEKHLRAWNHPNPDGLVAYFSPDGRFHAQGVEREHQLALIGMMGGVVA
ncbi:nuclear transport factor 2 family protein [Cnuibacter physcomitrellae]|uniref:nuclear transport factor 2 family protein n=1 Tax=Cnuibacter physcomitrellae TaxID=1619308 RepID=UPI002176136D|nr:nuclear transport factor 2 family protein [Cnuibacter physcomitrellae]MCS5497222.1 nuclear transport factor 2 family protein [Cnuibacter physcomitrellae]